MFGFLFYLGFVKKKYREVKYEVHAKNLITSNIKQNVQIGLPSKSVPYLSCTLQRRIAIELRKQINICKK